MQEHFAETKKRFPHVQQSEIMKILSVQYKEEKNQRESIEKINRDAPIDLT